MPRITTQQDFKVNKNLPFCYLCGEPLDNGEPTDVDHCPPKSIFSKQDRADYPIVVKVHKKCNHDRHLDDEMLSLLFDPLSKQGKVDEGKHRAKMEKRKVSLNVFDRELDGYTNLPLRPFASRVVQCMHAILYKEYFPNGVVRGEIIYPFAELSQEGEWISARNQKQALDIAQTLGASIKADTFDCIIAYNSKFKYVCCWSPYDDISVCLYAFDIMNMSQMAAIPTGLPKVVVGNYRLKHPQSEYSKATSIMIPLSVEQLEYPLPREC